jgi:hypothetical protein
MGNSYPFYLFLKEFFAIHLTTFWRISAKTHELSASILCCWRPCCWRLLSGILAVAGLPSAVDAVMFLLSLLQLASLHAVAGFTVFASIPAFDCVHTACVGAPVVSYIPAVACVPAVVSGHYTAVSLLLTLLLLLLLASRLWQAFLLLLAP